MLLQHLVVIGARRYAMDDPIWEYSRQASVFQKRAARWTWSLAPQKTLYGGSVRWRGDGSRA